MLSSARLFSFVVAKPWLCLTPLLVLLVLAVGSLAGLEKDTRSDAFLAPDNPALLYRDVVREQFGLTDPMLIALVADGPDGVFDPPVLASIVDLTAALASLPNVDADNILSLASESLIGGTPDGIEVEPLLDPLPKSAAEAQALRERVEGFPLFMGTLVSRDGAVAVIAAHLLDEDAAEDTYRAMLELLDSTALPSGVEAHVAGEGAIAGFLGAYIDADAQRLNPLASIIIVLMIVWAFRRLAPAMLAVLVIVASVGVALGSMAAMGIPFYVITNALPVILIGISVADTIHIFSHYYDLQARSPATSREALIVSTMQAMWLPITLTSLTTAAGFLGLYFAASMPPFKYFGLFAALGVATAWLYSLLALPALMALLKVQVAQRFIDQQRAGDVDGLAALLGRACALTLQYPRSVVLAYGALAVAGLWAASQITVDDDRIGLFNPGEPIVVADKVINTHLNGSNTLDIVIETPDSEGVFDPAVLKQIDALQSYALSLPHVRGASSIVDYLKQMNRVLTGGTPEDYRLPETRDSVAQYFLLYSFSADPDDFAQQVDYDYRTANVRITLNDGGYGEIKPVYESLNDYVKEHFSNDVRATMSGRVSLNYHWIHSIGDSHFRGLLIALLLVWIVASISFRSLVAGAYTLLPVLAAVLMVYSFMVIKGLTLGVGTSMFAAVAIGLGVDFAIHSLSRFQVLAAAGRGENTVNDASASLVTNGLEKSGDAPMFTSFFSTTGRALLLNVLAVACGFGVLVVSQVAQLRDFGSIVLLSMVVAFLASVTLLPALVLLRRPGFVFASPGGGAASSGLHSLPCLVCGLLLCLLLPLGAAPLLAAENLSADDIVARVNAVPQGAQVTRELILRTTDKKGRVRERSTISFRRFFGEERRLAMFFTEPANIRDTAVLTWDYPNTTEDDQWLYLPALRKVRRIPSAERGDYFLGTDFSFEDMKLDGQLSADDYDYTVIPGAGDGEYKLRAVPKTPAIAEELGYARTEAVVRSSDWIVLRVEFWDEREELLKTLVTEDVRAIDGILTRHRLTMSNHQTGHRTELLFSSVDYRSPVDESVFTQQALKRGL